MLHVQNTEIQKYEHYNVEYDTVSIMQISMYNNYPIPVKCMLIIMKSNLQVN